MLKLCKAKLSWTVKPEAQLVQLKAKLAKYAKGS